MTREFSITHTSVTAPGDILLMPVGLSTPSSRCLGWAVEGAETDSLREATTGQEAVRLRATGEELIVIYRYSDEACAYPEAMFQPTQSRFTRAAEGLGASARAMAGLGDDLTRARRIACAVAETFTYGHTDDKFYDGYDHVPELCDMTTGSCVDINTYFLAALRAAGIEAGYITGYFFPAEKRDHCNDMHCWVVTRIGGKTQEWDIAHHLKMGTRDIHPALNPKPGFRAAVAHSMGLTFADANLHDIKLLGEPMPICDGALGERGSRTIRLTHPAL